MDANAIIYSYERVTPYTSVLDPYWQSAYAIITSELSLLEVLVEPLKIANARLEAGYRALLLQLSNVQRIPITLSILERAAHLRATTNLKTPGANHAASALEAKAGLFLTNDRAFQRISGLPVTLIDELLMPSHPLPTQEHMYYTKGSVTRRAGSPTLANA